MILAVGVAHGLAQEHTRALMGFGGESKQAAIIEEPRNLADQRRQIGAIRQRVRRDHEIGATPAFTPEKFEHVRHVQMIVVAGTARLLDHRRGEIDTDERIDPLGQQRSRKSGAAAEVERTVEPWFTAERIAGRGDGIVEKLRPAIVEPFQQRQVIVPRVLVEQRPHIAGRHRRGRAGQPRKLNRGPMAILRIGGARVAECRGRRLVVAEPHPHLPECEPGRGEARHDLDRLEIEIGRGGKIAALLELLGELETAVGDQIAGGDEELHRGT
jgi:hypothetical protein